MIFLIMTTLSVAVIVTPTTITVVLLYGYLLSFFSLVSSSLYLFFSLRLSNSFYISPFPFPFLLHFLCITFPSFLFLFLLSNSCTSLFSLLISFFLFLLHSPFTSLLFFILPPYLFFPFPPSFSLHISSLLYSLSLSLFSSSSSILPSHLFFSYHSYTQVFIFLFVDLFFWLFPPPSSSRFSSLLSILFSPSLHLYLISSLFPSLYSLFYPTFSLISSPPFFFC